MRRNDLEKVVIGLISSLTYYKHYSFHKRGWISCLKRTAEELHETFSVSTLISVLVCTEHFELSAWCTSDNSLTLGRTAERLWFSL